MSKDYERVGVEYSVRVEAIVNLETGKVERAIVHDTSTSYPETVWLYTDGDFPEGPYPADLVLPGGMGGDTLEQKEAARAAVEIAETAVWPAWEVGE